MTQLKRFQRKTPADFHFLLYAHHQNPEVILSLLADVWVVISKIDLPGGYAFGKVDPLGYRCDHEGNGLEFTIRVDVSIMVSTSPLWLRLRNVDSVHHEVIAFLIPVPTETIVIQELFEDVVVSSLERPIPPPAQAES